jgi:hypothetical protein
MLLSPIRMLITRALPCSCPSSVAPNARTRIICPAWVLRQDILRVRFCEARVGNVLHCRGGGARLPSLHSGNFGDIENASKNKHFDEMTWVGECKYRKAHWRESTRLVAECEYRKITDADDIGGRRRELMVRKRT